MHQLHPITRSNHSKWDTSWGIIQVGAVSKCQLQLQVWWATVQVVLAKHSWKISHKQAFKWGNHLQLWDFPLQSLIPGGLLLHFFLVRLDGQRVTSQILWLAIFPMVGTNGNRTWLLLIPQFRLVQSKIFGPPRWSRCQQYITLWCMIVANRHITCNFFHASISLLGIIAIVILVFCPNSTHSILVKWFVPGYSWLNSCRIPILLVQKTSKNQNFDPFCHNLSWLTCRWSHGFCWFLSCLNSDVSATDSSARLGLNTPNLAELGDRWAGPGAPGELRNARRCEAAKCRLVWILSSSGK